MSSSAFTMGGRDSGSGKYACASAAAASTRGCGHRSDSAMKPSRWNFSTCAALRTEWPCAACPAHGSGSHHKVSGP